MKVNENSLSTNGNPVCAEKLSNLVFELIQHGWIGRILLFTKETARKRTDRRSWVKTPRFISLINTIGKLPNYFRFQSIPMATINV